MDHKRLGQNILHFLNEQGMTQVELANGIGASKQVVNKIIKGKKALLTEELIEISTFLNVEITQLINSTYEVNINGKESLQLLGELSSEKEAKFIYSLIKELAEVENDLEEYGII